MGSATTSAMQEAVEESRGGTIESAETLASRAASSRGAEASSAFDASTSAAPSRPLNDVSRLHAPSDNVAVAIERARSKDTQERYRAHRHP